MGIKSKNIDNASNVNQYTLQIGTARLQSATAAADTQMFAISRNSRLVEYLLGAKNKGSADTGGLNVGLYLGATATAGALLTSATARLATSEVATGTLATQSLNTSIFFGMNGGMIVSAGSVILLDVVQASASHSVGIIFGSLTLELDE